MLDRTRMSNRAALMIIVETSRAVGQDTETFALNRSTIQRLCQKHREIAASRFIQDFEPITALTVHWDGKLMQDLTGTEKVDHFSILVLTMGKMKLLDIPKIYAGINKHT